MNFVFSLILKSGKKINDLSCSPASDKVLDINNIFGGEKEHMLDTFLQYASENRYSSKGNIRMVSQHTENSSMPRSYRAFRWPQSAASFIQVFADLEFCGNPSPEE